LTPSITLCYYPTAKNKGQSLQIIIGDTQRRRHPAEPERATEATAAKDTGDQTQWH